MPIQASELEMNEFAEANRKLDQKKYKLAYELFVHAAERGNVLALNSVGYLLDHGIGVRKQPELAMYWYRKGAQRGDPIACTNLGLSYQYLGKSGLAVKWIKRAASIGDADGALDLGKKLIERQDAVSQRLAKVYLKIATSSPHLDAADRRDIEKLVHRKESVSVSHKRRR